MPSAFCRGRIVLFVCLEGFVHLDDLSAQNQGDEPRKQKDDKGSNQLHKPAHPRNRADAYDFEHQKQQKKRGGIPEENADEGIDVDLPIEVPHTSVS